MVLPEAGYKETLLLRGLNYNLHLPNGAVLAAGVVAPGPILVGIPPALLDQFLDFGSHHRRIGAEVGDERLGEVQRDVLFGQLHELAELRPVSVLGELFD